MRCPRSSVRRRKSAGTDYTADLANGVIKFTTAPAKPQDVVQVAGEDGAENVMYPEFYAGIEVTAKKTYTSVSGVTEETDNIAALITECTLAAIYDNRVFLSGNPELSESRFLLRQEQYRLCRSVVFRRFELYAGRRWEYRPLRYGGRCRHAYGAERRHAAGRLDLFPYGDRFGHDIQPRIYPAQQGLSGSGCLGACINFLDDPVFVSRLGVEGVGQLSVRYERAVEHRSSLIDAKLVNMKLETAVLEEWNGYPASARGRQHLHGRQQAAVHARHRRPAV